MQALVRFLQRVWSWIAARIPKRSARYWIFALIFFVVATWTAPFVDSRLNLTSERSWLFEHLAQSVTNPAAPRNVKLLLIGDDEFWDGDLHHRVPTDRSYLARLVRTLDLADASVVAIDFDVRLPHPSSSVAPGDYAAVDVFEPYRKETDALIAAIDDVAQRRKIVLSKTIAGPVGGPYAFVDDIYQAYGICTKLNANGEWVNPGTPEFPLTADAQQNISCGYIDLMPDKRRVPPPIPISGEPGMLNSFSLAIVRARDPAAAPSFGSRRYYASYISDDLATNRRITVWAHDLLRDPLQARSVLRGWPVVVGADWSQRAKGSGGLVDQHDTPIGKVSGAIVHENLAEAVLSNRVFPEISEYAGYTLEILISILAALVFASLRSLWLNFAAVVLAMIGLFLVQWLTLQLAGTSL